jgi:hypothetical protein
MLQYFSVKRPTSQWGDYSDILIHGLVDFDCERLVGTASLMRVDDWVPDIGLPLGMMFVSQRLKLEIEKSKFHVLLGRQLQISKATRIGWRRWNLSAEEPERYPAGGEPENYILARKNHEETRLSIPSLWRLKSAIIDLQFARWKSQIERNPAEAPHLASYKGEIGYYVSEDFKKFLQSLAPEAVKFVAV